MVKIITKEYRHNNKHIVFHLTGWSNQQWMYWAFAKILNLFRMDCVVYTYGSDILTPNVDATYKNFHTVKDDVLERIATYKKNGYTKISLFGTSIGNNIAFLVANNSKDVHNMIVNITGADLARTVWTWDIAVIGFKQQLLDQKMTLAELKKEWSALSPINNSDNLSQELLLYTSQNDEIIPYSQQKKLQEKLQKNIRGLKIFTNTFLPHVPSCTYNLVRFSRYIVFLKS